jgi:uncharacterized protein
MTSAEGAFYTSEDADSEGEEGMFYIWSHQEIMDVLEKEELSLLVYILRSEKIKTSCF